MYKINCSYLLFWLGLQATSSSHLTRNEDKWSPREGKRMVKPFFFFQIVLFGHVLKKGLAHLFSGAWSFFLVHIWFTPSEGPKAFETGFFSKSDHENWTMNSGHWKNPLSWSDFMVHSVNRPYLFAFVNVHVVDTATRRNNDVASSNCMDVVWYLSSTTSFDMFSRQQTLLKLDYKTKYNFDLTWYPKKFRQSFYM